MKKPTKTISWKGFNKRWSNPFDRCRAAVRLIHLYPERVKFLELGTFVTEDLLTTYQKDWLRLLSQLDHRETDFLKPWFVPVSRDEYKLFIDLSNPDLPLVEPVYLGPEKGWKVLTRVPRIVDLILFLDSREVEYPFLDAEYHTFFADAIEDAFRKEPPHYED